MIQSESREMDPQMKYLYEFVGNSISWDSDCNLGTSSETKKELEEIVRIRNEEREVWNATNGRGSGVYK